MHSCQNNPEKSYIEKKLYIKLLVIRFLQIIQLTQWNSIEKKKQTNLILAEEKVVWKGSLWI